MKFSTRDRYALRLMVELANHPKDLVPLKEISDAQASAACASFPVRKTRVRQDLQRGAGQPVPRFFAECVLF